MKSLIIMMNAMKHYKHDDLVNQDSGVQEMLGQDISAPNYSKLVDMVHNKHFRFIKRK